MRANGFDDIAEAVRDMMPTMAKTPEFIYVARKVGSKARIDRVRADTYKRKTNSRPGSINDPALSEKLTAAFVKAVTAAKKENAKLRR